MQDAESKLSESVACLDADELMLRKREIYIRVLITGIDFLENLSRGPHRANQSQLASSDAISVVNRVLQYIDWRVESDDEHSSQLELKHIVLRMLYGILQGEHLKLIPTTRFTSAVRLTGVL